MCCSRSACRSSSRRCSSGSTHSVFKVDTLHVMSAFRTPYYNHAIGDVKYSMHQWGSAADIYVDPQKNDRMADLNRDGQVDVQDSKLLYDEIERMLASKELCAFPGRHGLLSGNVRPSAVRPCRCSRHEGAVEGIGQRRVQTVRARPRCAARAAGARAAGAGGARIPCWRTRPTSTRCGTARSRPLLRAPLSARRRATSCRRRAPTPTAAAVIQDLGYYPFGSHFFSNLLHYVRTGDFVEALIREAQDVNEYAFALGALAHYAADNVGHPEAVNRAVRADVSRSCARSTATRSPTRIRRRSHVHRRVLVRRRAGGQRRLRARTRITASSASRWRSRCSSARSGDLRHRDERCVPRPRIWRSARIATPISETIPEITRIAWRDKREEIRGLNPGAAQENVRLQPVRARNTTRPSGTDYQKPGLLARFLAFLYRLLPKIGPLKPLQFKAPTKEAEALFLESFKGTRERYKRRSMRSAAGRLDLPNTNFDTGKPSGTRRIHAGRRHLRRTAGPADGASARHRARRVARQHRRVLRVSAESVLEQERAKRAGKINERLAALNAR